MVLSDWMGVQNLIVHIVCARQYKLAINTMSDRWNNEWDSEDESDTPDDWDAESSSEESICVEKIAEEQSASICTVDRPYHWKKSVREPRKVRPIPKAVQDPYHSRLYIEPKQSKKKKKAADRGREAGVSGATVRPPVIDPRYDDWQKRASQCLIDGKNLVIDSATSCGKTWWARGSVAEMCLRTDATALIITPNYEILNENVNAIQSDNRKTYQRKGATVTGRQTRKLNYIQDNVPPGCQIMCMTADNATDFMSSALNKEFMNKLQYIIMDEVHTGDVNNALWRLALIPPGVQFILLSATIGNAEWLCRELQRYRTETPVILIQWHIRPIPLQRALFNTDLTLSDGGAKVNLGSDDDDDMITFCPNLVDPTPTDVQMLMKIKGGDGDGSGPGPSPSPGSGREAEYEFGQKLVQGFSDENHNMLRETLTNAAQNSLDLDSLSPEKVAPTVLAMMQTLHSRDLSPALIFNSDPSQLVVMAKQLLATLQNMEHEDKEVRQQLKNIDKAEKQARRRRDEEDKIRHIKNEEDYAKLRIVEIPCSPDKWRFSRFKEALPHRLPTWMGELLHYGIGFYTASMQRRHKDAMFKWFENRKIAFMLCDRSLSLGINLPARTVVLTGDVDKTIMDQMGGRAGRRGHDTEGYVFLATAHKRTRQLLLEAEKVRKIQPLASLSMVDILRWNRNHSYYNTEAIKGYLQRHEELESSGGPGGLGGSGGSGESGGSGPDGFGDYDDFMGDDSAGMGGDLGGDLFGGLCYDGTLQEQGRAPVAVEEEQNWKDNDDDDDSDSDHAGQPWEIYTRRLNWLRETGWFRSKYEQLVLTLEDPVTMMLVHLIRKGKLDHLLVSSLDKSKDFHEVARPFMTLLCYLWEARPKDEGGQLDPLDPGLAEQVRELIDVFGLDVSVDRVYSDYILRFMRNGENCQKTRDAIGKFQMRFFDLMTALGKMTSGSMDETEPLLSLMTRIDERMWKWCQQWSVLGVGSAMSSKSKNKPKAPKLKW